MKGKVVHILNGTSLEHRLTSLSGHFVILKECMIEGDVSGDELEDILLSRMRFFSATYGIDAATYRDKSLLEISKLQQIDEGSDIYFWFEYDLFCQVNFWFAVSVIMQQRAHYQLYLVPPMTDSWRGFSAHSQHELLDCFQHNRAISGRHQRSISAIWMAYQNSDFQEMRIQAKLLKEIIPSIEEVVEAHIDRYPLDDNLGRPEKLLCTIYDEGKSRTFAEIFHQFSQQAGIYGFGDVQVRRMLRELNLDTFE